MPPLEARLGLTYERESWSAGALWRVVAQQSCVNDTADRNACGDALLERLCVIFPPDQARQTRQKLGQVHICPVKIGQPFHEHPHGEHKAADQ